MVRALRRAPHDVGDITGAYLVAGMKYVCGIPLLDLRVGGHKH